MRIVTTIFPIYDWVLNILGENPAEADVTMLLDTGVDFHSFQPSAEDILIVQNTRTKDQQLLTMDSMQATNAEDVANGKTIKMEGLFSYYYDEETGQEYFSCIIQDETACCAQGIEFVLAGEYSYPEEDAEICVVGVFDTYREGDATYCTLRNAKML